jgi:translation initiation factor 2 beta subunit (eIF-2beta)/eIF-5
MTLNMNGNKLDTNYRYTMPEFDITIAGKSSGIYTIVNNINDISKSINHPSEVIMKYIAVVTGSNYIQSRESISGSHTIEELNNIIIEYIKYLVFCQRCFIPETVPCLTGSKKNIKLNFCCSGCKTTMDALIPNKRIEKGIDIIIKYLKTDSEWKMEKGTIVRQDNDLGLSTDIQDINIQKYNNEINPFDFI